MFHTHTTYSHTTLSRTTYSHTTLSHTTFSHTTYTQLILTQNPPTHTHNLYTTYSHTTLTHIHNSLTQLTHNLLTQKSPTHNSLTHNYLHTARLTHNSITHRPSLSHTGVGSHTQTSILTHRRLARTLNLLTHNSHTQLSHTRQLHFAQQNVALMALGWLWWHNLVHTFGSSWSHTTVCVAGVAALVTNDVHFLTLVLAHITRPFSGAHMRLSHIDNFTLCGKRCTSRHQTLSHTTCSHTAGTYSTSTSQLLCGRRGTW